MKRRTARLAAIAATLGLVAPAAAVGQGAAPETNLPDIEDEVMCPVCGTTLELAEAPQAERERELIRRLIDRGLTKEEVKDELVAEYGEEVLATPSASGFDLTAWLLPGLVLALVGGAIAFGLWRARGSGGGDPPPLDRDERERLDADIASYDG